MLVLSREVGQSFIINESVVFTVAVIGADFVDLLQTGAEGRKRGVITLTKGNRQQIMQGVTALLIHEQADRARFGFEYPSELISIRRLELVPKQRIQAALISVT